jgi:hypothetical protein
MVQLITDVCEPNTKELEPKDDFRELQTLELLLVGGGSGEVYPV